MKLNLQTPKMKIMFIVYILLVVIVVVVLLVMLFMPSEAQKNAFKYTSYTTNTANAKMKDKYFEKVSNLLVNKNIKEMYNLMNKDFLKENNINSLGDFSKYMGVNRYLATQMKTEEYKFYQNEDKNIYIIKFSNDGGGSGYLNIIETSPYNFTVAFGDKTYDEQDNKTYEAEVEGINVKIKRTYKNMDELYYDITFTNVSNESVEFDFVDVTRIQLVTSTNYRYQMSHNVSSADDGPLTKKSSVTKTFVYFVPAEEQQNIKYLSIADVKINGVEKTILVPFK